MKYALLVALIFVAACSSPTAPTPPPVTVTPPVVATPPPVMAAPPANPLLSDPRFDLGFYRQFALGTLDYSMQPLRRQTQAPRIYLRTVDDANRPIDPQSLTETAAALIDVTGQLTGVFGVAGLERGTETREGQPGWITVRWAGEASPEHYCGVGDYAGDRLVLFPRTAGCRCAGGGAIKPLIVKHEMGHVLGFYHTDSLNDLMHAGGHTACDMQPSAREIYHAKIAYSQPLGSFDPR